MRVPFVGKCRLDQQVRRCNASVPLHWDLFLRKLPLLIQIGYKQLLQFGRTGAFHLQTGRSRGPVLSSGGRFSNVPRTFRARKKPFVKLRPAYSVKLVFLCHMLYPLGSRFSKVPRTVRARKASCQTVIRLFWKADLLISFKEDCEVWWLRTSALRRYKGNCGTRNRPEKFRDFWETGPRSWLFEGY